MSKFAPHKTEEYSVIDPIKPNLDQTIIVGDKLSPEVRKKLLKAVKLISEKTGLELNNVWLIGSSISYQWTDETDLDITLLLKEKKTPEELKEINKLINENYNSKLFLGSHPVNFHARGNYYSKFNADSIYDLIDDKWIKKPEVLDEKEVAEIIQKCSSAKEFNEILREYNELNLLLKSYDGTNTVDIISKALKVSYLFNKIKDQRREDFKKRPDKDIPSANFRCSNIIFKLLESYGLDSLAVQIATILDSRFKN